MKDYNIQFFKVRIENSVVKCIKTRRKLIEFDLAIFNPIIKLNKILMYKIIKI